MTHSELQASLDRKAADIARTLAQIRHMEQVQASLLDHTVSADEYKRMLEHNKTIKQSQKKDESQ